MANLEVMLHVIGSFGEELPPACLNTCQEAWAVFDAFIARYGFDYESTEHVTRVLRHGINLFGSTALPVAPAVLARMASAFEVTGMPSYLWIGGKLLGRFGNEEDPVLRDCFRQLYERSTKKVVALLQERSPNSMPDGESVPPTLLEYEP